MKNIALPTTPLLIWFGAVVFLANSGLLVLQLVAPRYLAPFIGSSVETWTSVIGVFLTGIAIGNHFGGKIADRSPSVRTLGILLLLGAAGAVLMIGWPYLVRTTGFDSAIPLKLRIPFLAALFCLPPAIALSLITPLTIKLMLSDVSRAGRVAGLVFSLSTLGCLIGNYATGFWFMADYSLNQITIGVAVGLVVLGLPMLFSKMWFESIATTPAPKAASKPTGPAVDDPLGFKKDIRRAYLFVFVASFCGMSLELTASRLLAPVVGWSLYTWTGIIGVMLAGTACGNYLGGIIADRGWQAGIVRFFYLMAGLVGFAAGPAFIRSLTLTGYPYSGTDDVWQFRGLGAAGGVLATFVCLKLMQGGRRRWLPSLACGAVLGYAVAHLVVKSIWSIFVPKDGGGGSIDELFQSVNESFNFDVGSLVIHLVVAAVGAGIAFGLSYDPKPETKPSNPGDTLAMCIFGAAIFVGIIVIALGTISRRELGQINVIFGSDLIWNVLTITFLLFFVPMLCLGTVSPQIIRLSITDTARAGRTAGSIYAWSTAGAIVGTFAAGYLLIELLGMNRVIFLLAAILVVMAVVIGRYWTKTSTLFVASILFFVAAVGMITIDYGGNSYTYESKYYAIKVEDSTFDGVDVKSLSLDHLAHSYVNIKDPTFLGYKHEEIQGDLVRFARINSRDGAHVLVIGGGGYTFPRWTEVVLPDVNMDVVEIDPAVTEVAHRELGLPRDTRIKSHHMDGRQFMREKAQKGHYHVVIQDAVNDLSVPWHLMTKEYNESVKATLAPDGVYLLTLIDSIEEGELWRAAVNTMRESFPHVEMLDPSGFVDTNGRHVYVIYGANHPLDVAKVQAAALASNPNRQVCTLPLSQEQLNHHVQAGRKIVLTDQYAPVDNLMADVFRRQLKGR